MTDFDKQLSDLFGPAKEAEDTTVADQQETVEAEKFEHINIDDKLDAIDQEFGDIETIQIIAGDTSNKEKIAKLLEIFKQPTESLESGEITEIDPEELSAELVKELEDALEYYFSQFTVASTSSISNIHDKAFTYMTKQVEKIMTDFAAYRGTVGELGEATRVLKDAKASGKDIKEMIELADKLDQEIEDLNETLQDEQDKLLVASDKREKQETTVQDLKDEITALAEAATIAKNGQGYPLPEEGAAEGEAQATEGEAEATQEAAEETEEAPVAKVKGIVQLQLDKDALGWTDFSAKSALNKEIKDKQALIEQNLAKIKKLKEKLVTEENALKNLKASENKQQAAYDKVEQEISEKQAVLAENDTYRALRVLVQGENVDENESYNEQRKEIITSALGLVEGSKTKLTSALDALDISKENLSRLRDVSRNVDEDIKVLSGVIEQMNTYLHEKHDKFKAERDAIIAAQKEEALAFAEGEEEKAEIEANFSPKQTPELIAASNKLEAHSKYHGEFGKIAEEVTNFHQEIRENLQKNTVFVKEVDDKIKKTKRIRTSTIGKVSGEAGMVLNSLAARVSEGTVDLIDDMLEQTSAQAAQHFEDAVQGLVEHGKNDNSRLQEDIKQIDGFTEMILEVENELVDIAKTGAALREKKEDSLQDLEGAGAKLETAKDTGTQEGERAYRELKTQQAANENGKAKSGGIKRRRRGMTPG